MKCQTTASHPTAGPVPQSQPHGATVHRLGSAFGLTMPQVRCIQGSFAVLNDTSGEQFMLSLLMSDPEFHARLTGSEGAVAATHSFWVQLVNIIENLHLPAAADNLDSAIDHTARTLHKVAGVTVDDMMALGDLLQSRAREAVLPLACKYEATFAAAWEALLRPVFTFLSGNAPTVELSSSPLAVGVDPTTIIKLTQCSLSAVARHLTVNLILKTIPTTAEYASAHAAIGKLDGESLAALVTAAATHAAEPAVLHQLLLRAGFEHRAQGVHRHYSVLYAAVMGTIHRSLRVDYTFVVAAMARAWRRFLRVFNDRLGVRLGGSGIVPGSWAHVDTARIPEPPATQRAEGAGASPSCRRAQHESPPATAVAASSRGSSTPRGTPPPPPPPSEAVPTGAAASEAAADLKVLFTRHCGADGKVRRGVVMNLYLERTTGLDIDLKECTAAIERHSTGDALTWPQFESVMLRVTRQ